jgi:hypothetical protein
MDNLGDSLALKIFKNDFTTVFHRSVTRSAADANHRNMQEAFKPDVKQVISIVVVKSSPIIRNKHHRRK